MIRNSKTVCGLGVAAVLLGGCGTSGAMSAAGKAALRAGGIEIDDSEKKAAPQRNADEPHWSEEWVWEGDGA